MTPAPAIAGRNIDSAVGLSCPRCDKGIGDVIADPESSQLIDGVQVEPYPVHPDDRGYFMELARLGKGAVGGFDPATTQISAALSYAGTIKAFHYHLQQTDYWAVVAGMFQVALVDLREESPTFGRRNTMYVGTLRPWRVVVPPGVGHGYKVIGQDPGCLVYVTNRHYDPSDEGRIAYNDPDIQYDWELQHK